MWSITRQMMKKNLRMLIPAGIAILIGTAFIAATLLFSNAMDRAMHDQITADYGDANYAVTIANDEYSTDIYSTTYEQLHITQMEQTAGVEGVRPDITGVITLTHGEQNISDAVIASSTNTGLLPVHIVEGSAPAVNGLNEIAIPDSIASQWNIHAGDTIRINSQAYSDMSKSSEGVEAHVVGITQDYSGAYNYYGGVSVASNNLIAAMSGSPSINDVNVTLAYVKIKSQDAESVIAALNAQLPEGFHLVSRAELSDQSIKSMAGGTDITKYFLLAFGILALFVAALVIANTFQVLVAQRRKTLALLRTIGATRRQLYASVLQEALSLGFVASLLGVGAGCGLMALIVATHIGSSTMGSMHFVFTWEVAVVPLIFGTIMTVLASLSAARMATNVSPLEAMRPLEITNQRATKLGRAIIGSILLIAGIACSIYALKNTDSNSDAVLLLAIGGCAFIFLGAVLTAYFWMPWCMKAAGALAALTGPSGKLANANIQKNPRRVAATGTALLIGVTLISTLATGAAAAKSTMSQALDTRYSVDIMVGGSDIPQQAANKVDAVKGVQASLYAPTAEGVITDAQGERIASTIIGVPNAQALQSVVNADLGNISLGQHDAIVQQYNPDNGDNMQFKTDATVTEQRYDENTDEFVDEHSALLHVQQCDMRRVTVSTYPVVFVNEELFTNGTFSAQSHVMFIKLNTQDATIAQSTEDLTKLFEAYPGIVVAGVIAERDMWNSMVNMMLTLLVGLLAVAVIIAVIGVANTLSLSVIERTRESATLRAIGMTRGQLRMSLCLEAIIIALVSSIVGMILGTIFGWIGITMVMSSIAEVVYSVDWVTYVVIFVIAVLCAVLASVFPARRAVKTAPVEALAES